ncbi:hypothetical protein [Legionella oakridgensis]|uniref:Uncharacterized protein n=2 Tax=Legionella oakridgensis TaxID=29423 RepID=W0BGJ3_9GAMM|nr:hypothetical protein [Legionella oakridgensis]AHE67554.1 hypothetical protein Loa_02010 [Legionella oakridgensis ATCC 33761 = DSM 21215]ETO92800.1 hypothetical protein LOR_61c14540 [Legionella oakridgensis RV-2-2007]KTD37094.1 hypothetical protein Loak_2230 [Legionella oakridgensis]STY20597.1 Uncharacterised protein [Legionella longbeachae]
MPNKILTARLNHELDELGVPSLITERVQACSKLFKLPKFKVEALLNGVVTIDSNSMQKIADELEVNKDWLLGNIQRKTTH